MKFRVSKRGGLNVLKIFNDQDGPTSLPVQGGNKIITRKFALLPSSSDKKRVYKQITDRMVKFRDVENVYVRKMVEALRSRALTLQDFAPESKAHVKKNIYDGQDLNTVSANQFKYLELKERMKRCAIQYPYQAVRNWLIRNENLAVLAEQLIDAFSKQPVGSVPS
jgi:hypothetical protein